MNYIFCNYIPDLPSFLTMLSYMVFNVRRLLFNFVNGITFEIPLEIGNLGLLCQEDLC